MNIRRVRERGEKKMERNREGAGSTRVSSRKLPGGRDGDIGLAGLVEASMRSRARWLDRHKGKWRGGRRGAVVGERGARRGRSSRGLRMERSATRRRVVAVDRVVGIDRAARWWGKAGDDRDSERGVGSGAWKEVEGSPGT